MTPNFAIVLFVLVLAVVLYLTGNALVGATLLLALGAWLLVGLAISVAAVFILWWLLRQTMYGGRR